MTTVSLMVANFAPALRSRNFRLFWLGQVISIVGTSVQVVAEGWLIYDLTQSTLWLGLVGLLALLPVLPISLVGGVLIDRVPRRKLILATQSCLMAQALIFALLVQTGTIRLWHIILLYFFFGAILAIDHPARRAFLVDLVDGEDLANAVALNATVFNLSSLIGYAAAGVLIAMAGVGMTMFLNAVSYLGPIAALLAIRVADVGADRPPQGEAKKKLSGAMWEGVMTLWRQPAILGAIAVMAAAGGMAAPVFGLMPAFAEEVLHTDSVGLGILMAAGALGSVIGTVLVARLGVHGRGRTLVGMGLALPWLVGLFGISPNLWVACLLLILIGGALLILQSLTITLVQVHIPDRVRGRVMSLYSQIHAGSDTMGNATVGALASITGLPLALGAAGAAVLVFVAALRWWMPAVRQLD